MFQNYAKDKSKKDRIGRKGSLAKQNIWKEDSYKVSVIILP